MNTKHQRGQILILTIIVIGAVGAFSLLLHGMVQQNNKFSNIRYHQEKAIQLAQAGIDHARWDLNQNLNFSGSTITTSEGTFVTTITQAGSNLVHIESTGYSPSQSNPTSTRTIRVDAMLDTNDVSFNYGVQVGEGGVQMNNGSQIIGNVFSNGSISGSGTITGTAQVATGAQLGATNETQSSGTDGDYIFGQASPTLDASQSFQPNTTATITRVSLLLKKACQNNQSNKCPPNLTMRILADASGSPDKNNVIATGTLTESLVSMNAYGWTDITIGTPTTLTAGQTYWIMLSASDGYPSGNTDRYWYWGKDKNQGYGNGVGKSSADWNASLPTWSTIIGDLDFRVYMGSNTTYLDGVRVNTDAYAYEIKNTTVGGDAYYQVITNTNVSGSACPNSHCHPNTAPSGIIALPLSDANIQDFKDEGIAGGTTTGDVTVNATTMSLGPKEITGNLTVTNGADLTVNGTIYVHGTVSISNNAKVHLASAYGNTSGTIVADGKVDVSNNVIFCGSGWNGSTCNTSNGSYIMVLTTSSKQLTSDPAVNVSNNAAAVIFYASSGLIKLNNNAGLYEAVGYKIYLENNATVTYQAGLANAKFTSGPGASWQVQPGTWREIR